MKVTSRLTALMDQLGIERAHFGVQNTAELDPIIAEQSGRIATLTMVGPNRLQASTLEPVQDRLLIAYGGDGAGGEAAKVA